MPLKKVLCNEQYPQQIMKSLSDLSIHFHNLLFEKVLCRSMVNWSMSELLFIQHEKTNWSIS